MECGRVHILKEPHIEIHESIKHHNARAIISVRSYDIICYEEDTHGKNEQYGIHHKYLISPH